MAHQLSYRINRSNRPLLRLFLLSILTATTLPADSLFTDLETHLIRARENSPELLSLLQHYEAAKARAPQAAAFPEPTVRWTEFVESIQTRTGPQERAFALNQKVPWFGKLDHRQSVATKEAEALYHAYRDRQLQLANQVSSAYFEYAYAEKADQLIAENLELLRKLEPVVEDKVRTGGALNELLRLKVEMGKVQDRRLSLDPQRTTQKARLRTLTGAEAEVPPPQPDWKAPLPISFDEDRMRKQLEEHHPGLRLWTLKAESAEVREKLARLDAYPDLSLGVQYFQVGESNSGSSPQAGNDPWNFTVGITIPLRFQKYDAAKQEALAQKRAFHWERRHKQLELEASLSENIARAEDAHRRLQLYGKELLTLATQAAENSRSGYESGGATLLEVIDSERSLLELQLLYWRAAADAWKARIQIRTLTNQTILGFSPLTPPNHE